MTKNLVTHDMVECSVVYLLNLKNIFFTQYCAGGEIETNEMGRACGAYGGG